MSSKVYIDGYPALIESRSLGAIEVNSMVDADFIVNPKHGNIFNKTIIINLPTEMPINKLRKFNKVLSRFDLGIDGIEIVPYEIPKNRKKLRSKDYSLLILTKDMINDVRYAQLIENNQFLVGVDECVDDNTTLVGYLISRSKVEDL